MTTQLAGAVTLITCCPSRPRSRQSSTTPPNTGSALQSTPLRPPDAVTGIPDSLQRRITADISSTDEGRTTAPAMRATRPVVAHTMPSGHQSRLASTRSLSTTLTSLHTARSLASRLSSMDTAQPSRVSATFAGSIRVPPGGAVGLREGIEMGFLDMVILFGMKRSGEWIGKNTELAAKS